MLDTLKDVLEDQIKDLYNAENQLVKALPKLAKRANDPGLREAFENHLEQTKGHVERLESVAEILEIKPSGKTCKAMKGLIEEGKEVLDDEGDGPAVDAALIAAAQRVEHYEISAYGSARAMAEQLGEDKVIQLLQQTLDEERAADEKLTDISTGGVLAAADGGRDEEED
jgi:ferritin-like metal-binding protein YciE